MRRTRRAVTAAAIVVGCAVPMVVVGAGQAHAVDPDRLRPGCVWRNAEDRAADVQTCTLQSTSLGRKVSVQIRPSNRRAGETEHGIYFLDGLGSNPEYSLWSQPESGALSAYSRGENLVMPAGGAGEWMTDWQQAPTGERTAPQWKEFIGSELPAYLNRNFDVGESNNAIVGVSMSAGPAVIIALDHPGVFTVVRSYSGYYETNNPFGWMAIPTIQQQRADIENGRSAMWGIPGSPGNTWADNDVISRIGEVATTGQTVMISSGTGIPTIPELNEAGILLRQEFEKNPGAAAALIPQAGVALMLGIGLEAGALMSTAILQSTARRDGLPIAFTYGNGGHNWFAWAINSGKDARAIEKALAERDTRSSRTASSTTAQPRNADAQPRNADAQLRNADARSRNGAAQSRTTSMRKKAVASTTVADPGTVRTKRTTARPVRPAPTTAAPLWLDPRTWRLP